MRVPVPPALVVGKGVQAAAPSGLHDLQRRAVRGTAGSLLAALSSELLPGEHLWL